MTELEAMLCRIGSEQEANGDLPFPFMCADAEVGLVEQLRSRGFVEQRWAGRGPAVVRFQDGHTTFNSLSLTKDGRSEWKRSKS